MALTYMMLKVDRHFGLLYAVPESRSPVRSHNAERFRIQEPEKGILLYVPLQYRVAEAAELPRELRTKPDSGHTLL